MINLLKIAKSVLFESFDSIRVRKKLYLSSRLVIFAFVLSTVFSCNDDSISMRSPESSSSVVDVVKGVPVTECGYLDMANTTYVLQNDVNTDGTCFIVIAPNITLDLNGHTIVYDDGQPITIANGDFEDGDGALVIDWDLSHAPDAQRIFGTYTRPVTVYSGSHALEFNVPAEDQYIRSKIPIALDRNTTYSISGMVYNKVSDDIALTIELEGSTIQTAKTRRTWRGFQYVSSQFTTGPLPKNHIILIRLTGAKNVLKGSVYIDDLKIQKYRVMGVLVGPESWQNPTILPRISRFGRARGARIQSGKIIQGKGTSNFSHAIAIEELSGWEYMVSNLEMIVGGPNSKAVSSINCHNSSIHSNKIYHNVKTIGARDRFDGAAIKIEYQGSNSHIFDNTILTGIQTGIYARSKTGAIPNRIYGNHITLQTKYTNDFAIVGDGGLIYENVVDCGHGNNSCRGIAAGGKGTKVYNNIINIQQLPRNQEYDGCQAYGAYGIQNEAGDDVEIYGNTVTAYADICEAYAFRANPMKTSGMGRNNSIYNNTFIVFAYGKARAASIKIASADAAALDIRNNTLITNRQWIYFDGHAEGLIFTENTFNAAVPKDNQLQPLSDYNWNGQAYPEDIVFLNNHYHDDGMASLFKNAQIMNGNKVDKSASYQYKWTLKVKIQNNSGLRIDGAGILITDKNNNTAFSGTTNESGLVAVNLSEYSYEGGIRKTYNPYTVAIMSNNSVIKKEIIIDMEKTLEVDISE